MRIALSALGLALFTLGLSAAPVKKEKEKQKDQDAIQGTWKIESFDVGGGPAPPAELINTIRFTFKTDGKLAVSRGQGDDKDGEFKLDPEAKPKTIDLVDNNRTTPGIYELDGDTLKICMAEGKDAVRPQEMKAEGMKVMLITFKRVKEDKKEEKKDK